MDIDWRSLPAASIVDIVDDGRKELERRRTEADECLELAFGSAQREAQAPKRGRPPKNAFPDNARGALDQADA